LDSYDGEAGENDPYLQEWEYYTDEGLIKRITQYVSLGTVTPIDSTYWGRGEIIRGNTEVNTEEMVLLSYSLR
jgi:hypothetical protein